MSTQFWHAILAGLKTIVENIENELSKIGNLFLSLIGQIITAEENIIMADAMPLVRQVATNLQNSQPGLSATDFINALISASIPVLEAEGIKLAHTAIGILASTVAHQLSIQDSQGNQGNIS